MNPDNHNTYLKGMMDKIILDKYTSYLNVIRLKYSKWSIDKIEKKVCQLLVHDHLKTIRKNLKIFRRYFSEESKKLLPKSDQEMVKTELLYIQSVLPICSDLRPENFILKTRPTRYGNRNDDSIRSR